MGLFSGLKPNQVKEPSANDLTLVWDQVKELAVKDRIFEAKSSNGPVRLIIKDADVIVDEKYFKTVMYPVKALSYMFSENHAEILRDMIESRLKSPAFIDMLIKTFGYDNDGAEVYIMGATKVSVIDKELKALQNESVHVLNGLSDKYSAAINLIAESDQDVAQELLNEINAFVKHGQTLIDNVIKLQEGL